MKTEKKQTNKLKYCGRGSIKLWLLSDFGYYFEYYGLPAHTTLVERRYDAQQTILSY